MADIARLILRVDSKGVAEAKTKVDNLTKSGQKAEKSFTALKGIIGVAFAGAVLRQAIKYSDAITQVNSRLSILIKSQKELVSVTDDLFKISQKNRAGYEETADLFYRIRRSFSELDVTTQEVTKATEALGKAIAISGGSAEGARAALIQLGQGFASGVLRGEEFNSIMEQAPRIAKALADSLGVTTGQLRNMAAEGALTSDVVLKGILSQASALNDEFSNIKPTIGSATTTLTNSLQKLVGEFSSTTGAGEGVAMTIIRISDNIDQWAKSNKTLLNQDLPEFFERMGSLIGPVAGAAERLVSAFSNIGRAIVLINNDLLDFSDLAFSSAEELDALLKQMEKDPVPREMRRSLIELQKEYDELHKLNMRVFRDDIDVQRFKEVGDELRSLKKEISTLEETSTLKIELENAMRAAGTSFDTEVRNRVQLFADEMRNAMRGAGTMEGPSKVGKVKKTGAKVLDPDLINRISVIKESLKTEEQLENESYTKRVLSLISAEEMKLLSTQEANALIEQEQARHQQRLSEIDKEEIEMRNKYLTESQASTIDAVGSIFGNLATLMSQGGKDAFEAYKVFAIAQAGVSGAMAVIQALAAPAPPPIPQILAATTGALVATQMAMISQQSYSGRALGGQVSSGTSYLVGERGPELLTMGNNSGNITPNNKLGGSGGLPPMTMVFQVSAGVEGTVRAEMMRMAPLIAAQAQSGVESAMYKGGSMSRAAGRRR